MDTFFENGDIVLRDGSFYAIESANIELDRCMLQYDTVSKLYELSCVERELQYMAESGDESELMEYYAEASEEADSKKESIMKRAWRKLKELIAKIKAALSKKPVPKNIDRSMKIEVDVVKGKMVTGIKSLWARAKPVLLNIKTKMKEHKVITALLALLVAGKVVKRRIQKKMMVTAGQLCDALNVFDDMFNTVDQAADIGFRQMQQEVEAENARVMQDIANAAHQNATWVHQQMTDMGNMSMLGF